MPDDLTDMQGRVAIVTGASRGIGLAIATELRRRGALVCLTARKDGQLQDAARGLGDESQVIAVAGAADDPVHRSEAVSRTMTTFGRVDMLVNNIGVNPVYGPLITATGLHASFFLVGAHAVVDMLCILIDPRIRRA